MDSGDQRAEPGKDVPAEEPETGTTIYAGWTKDFYTVTLNANGGKIYDYEYRNDYPKIFTYFL